MSYVALTVMFLSIATVVVVALYTVSRRELSNLTRKYTALEHRLQSLESQIFIPETASLELSRQSPGYVYLAGNDTGHYKIGVSTKPFKRVKHFNTIMPVEVFPIHFIPCVRFRELENELHHLFANQRHKGEWFELEVDDVEFICSMDAKEWN